MSYSTLDMLKQMTNKKVLFLDLETSGLLEEKRHVKQEEKYDVYTNNKYYDTCRIVQFGYYFTENFKIGDIPKADKITSVIRKPTDFEISKDATSVHKITTNDAIKNGTKIKEIFDGDFGKYIKNCDYVVGYNIFFDISVLLNELYRKEVKKPIEHLKKLFIANKILCLGVISSNVCKPKGWTKISQYQIPKMRDVYFECFGKYYGGEHDAKFDVLACIEITNHIIQLQPAEEENKKMYGKEITGSKEIENFGKKWKDDETELLNEEIIAGMKISQIAKSHSRTEGSIKSKLMSMAIKEMKDGKSKDYIQKKYGYNDDMYDACLIKKETSTIKKDKKTKKMQIGVLTNEISTTPVPNLGGNLLVQVLAKLVQMEKKIDMLIEKNGIKLNKDNTDGESDNESDSWSCDNDNDSIKSDDLTESEDELPKKKIKGIVIKK